MDGYISQGWDTSDTLVRTTNELFGHEKQDWKGFSISQALQEITRWLPPDDCMITAWQLDKLVDRQVHDDSNLKSKLDVKAKKWEDNNNNNDM